MCNDYRSFNMFMGMPSTGYKGQMTLRGEKNETGEEYAKRVLAEIHTWYGLGWQVERAYFDDGKIVKQVNVKTDADLNAALEKGTVISASPAPATTAPEGSGMFVMHIVKAEIVSDRKGLPQLEMYAAGHKYPDLRYSLGADLDTRKANISKLLSGLGKTPSPDSIKVGYSQDVNWDAVWKTGRDPKYKDVVSVGPHINGKAA